MLTDLRDLSIQGNIFICLFAGMR